MFTLAANMAHVGFRVTNGEARAQGTVHADQLACAKRGAERKKEGYVQWLRKRERS